MKSNKQLVEDYIEFYNNQNVPAMMLLFADDVVFESISNSGETTKTTSKRELEQLAKSSLQFFKERKQTPINWIVDEKRIAIEIDYRAVLAKDLSKDLKTGTVIKIRGASFFTFNNGLITRLTDYM